MSQVENGDNGAAEANPLAFRRDEAPLNPPVPLRALLSVSVCLA